MVNGSGWTNNVDGGAADATMSTPCTSSLGYVPRNSAGSPQKNRNVKDPNSVSSVGAVHVYVQSASAVSTSTTCVVRPATRTLTAAASVHAPSNVIVPPAPTTVFDAATEIGALVRGATVVVVVVVVLVVVDVLVDGGVVVVDVVVESAGWTGSAMSTEGFTDSSGVTAGTIVGADEAGPNPLIMNSPHVAVATATTVVVAPVILTIRES